MLNFHIYPADMRKDQLKDAQGLAQQTSAETQKLREDLHHLAIIAQAMWELLSEKSGLTNDELRKRITEVEFEKAKSFTSSTTQCKKCSRPISIRSKACLFCGEKVEHKEIFPM